MGKHKPQKIARYICEKRNIINMEWDATLYAKNASMQSKIGQTTIEKLKIQPNETVLDLGCGFGNLTFQIQELTQNGYVLGIDKDPQMIALAEDRTTIIPNLNVKPHFLNKDILIFTSEMYFDAIFSNIVIHWIKDQNALFSRVFKLLKPGGRISFAALSSDPLPAENQETSQKTAQKPKTKITEIELPILQNFLAEGNHLAILTQEEFLAFQTQVDPNLAYNPKGEKEFHHLLETSGFTDISIKRQCFIQQYQDLPSYFDSRASALWSFFLAYFPPKSRPMILDKIKLLITKKWDAILPTDRELPIIEYWPVLYLQARKPLRL